MRPRNHTLDSHQVHRAAAEHLQAHLQFKGYKRKTSAPVPWSLLLAAAARITSLPDACGRLRDAPSDGTARKALLATLPGYAELQRQLNNLTLEYQSYPSENLAKVIENLGLTTALSVPFDAKLFGVAANNGQMIEEVNPKSKAAEVLQQLTQLIARREAPPPPRKSALAGLFKRK